MLKETIICIIIVSAIFIGNFISQDYTKQTVTQLTDTLSDLRQKVIDKNDTQSQEKIENINKEWDNKKSKLAYYIEHDELEKIETGLTEIKSNIQTLEYEHGIEQIDKTIFLLEHVRDEYEVNLENIF